VTVLRHSVDTGVITYAVCHQDWLKIAELCWNLAKQYETRQLWVDMTTK